MVDYSLPNGLIQIDAPVEVGHNTDYFWFPSLHKVGGNALVCAVIRSADIAQGKWPADLFVSIDAGATWRFDQAIDSYGHISFGEDAATTLMMPYELWPISADDKRNGTAPGHMLKMADGVLTVEAREIRFGAFPADFADYHEDEILLHHTGNILRLADGSLCTMLYGKFAGDERYRNFAAASDDGGFIWSYLGTVATENDAPAAPEGPNESDVQLLDNGDLLCVYRVGGDWDFHKSYNADGGRTWSRSERMEGLWSVQPRLARLGNGALVLTGGRPGLFCYLCTDGKGEAWQAVNLGAHHNAAVACEGQRFSDAFGRAQTGEHPAMSTSYTSVMPWGTDGLLVTYDRLSNGWSGAPGPHGEVNRVFSVVLNISF